MSRKLFTLGFLLTFALLPALAQRITGSITGQVEDPKGALIQGAKVTVTNDATGYKLETSTSDQGAFSLPELAPADYKVTIQAPGFASYINRVTVRVGFVTPVNARLEVGPTTTEVTVLAAGESVDTQKSTVQGVITGDRIDQLPLNGRNFLSLAALEPGVQVVSGGSFDPTKNGMTGVSIGGRSGRVTRIQVDGVDITDETVGTTTMNITNESIQEFGISQSSLDPSTDLTSSGAVNIVTRSGTNDIHGSSFFQYRSSAIAADQRLDKGDPPTPKPDFDREIVGFRLGGPFIKNHLFWEVEYERNNTDSVISTSMPEFPQFSGSFQAPFDERIAGARLDWNVTSKARAFYRFNHNFNNGVTGFGGRDLSAFSNLNNTNSHVAGLDYTAGRWNHQVRFSYVNFNNGIVDANSLANTPDSLDPNGAPVLIRIGFTLRDVGPDLLAPQQTYQDNHQTKYDGSLVLGKHTLRFGGEWNRIDQFVFANFFGLAPRLRGAITDSGLAAGGPFSGGAENPLNYPVNQIVLGNGLGFFSEKPALGFAHGGSVNDRLGFYVQDNLQATRNLTLNFGVRYNFNTSLSDSDLERTAILSQFDPSLTGRPRRPGHDFGPQAGFAWNIHGDGKTVLRGGAGIFYETNVFNNVLFDRVLNIPPGLGNDTPVITSGAPIVTDPATGNTLFDFSTDCADVGGNCVGQPIGSVINDVLAATALLQGASASLAANWPPPGVPPLLNQNLSTGGSLIDTNYKTPRGYQFNIGIQRELKPGLVLALDYLHNRGVHFNLTVDRNRLGAADRLDVAIAQGAIAATLSDCGVATIDQSTINCPNYQDPADPLTLVPATMADYANFGVGKGSALDGFAFRGNNPNFRDMGVIESIGLSRFQALQVRLTGRVGTWGPFRNVSTNLTYSLGRFESTGADQDFLTTAGYNDRPTDFFGPATLDRTHQIGISFTTDLPLGFRVATATAIRSALPSSLWVPEVSGGADEIFYTDFGGDGVFQDPVPGVTPLGAFSRDVKAEDLNKVIDKYNSAVAGTITPAGQALVTAGLFTSPQLIALGAVAPSLAPAPAGEVGNDSFINTDIRLSKVFKIGERLKIEPQLEVFNLFNIANYDRLDDFLFNSAGSPNGTTRTGVSAAASGMTRVGATTGSFSPGVQRAFQFGIRVSF